MHLDGGRALPLLEQETGKIDAFWCSFVLYDSSQRNLSSFSSPFQLFLFHLYTVPGVNFTQCVTHGSFKEHWQETTYNMFTFTTLYITPLSVMVVCYVRILFEITKQLKINKGEFTVLNISCVNQVLDLWCPVVEYWGFLGEVPLLVPTPVSPLNQCNVG